MRAYPRRKSTWGVGCARTTCDSALRIRAALPRLDALVFTGGIGEHSGSVRSAIVRRLAPLGLGALPATDVRNDAVISRPGSAVALLRVEAREDAVIARQTAHLLH